MGWSVAAPGMANNPRISIILGFSTFAIALGWLRDLAILRIVFSIWILLLLIRLSVLILHQIIVAGRIAPSI